MAGRIVAVASAQESLAAHDRDDGAITVLGWAVDDDGVIQAIAVSSDGTVHLVPIDRVVFDHAVRPTDY